MKVIRWLCALDDAVLAWMTQWCHWFQRATGRTNYFLATWVGLVFVGSLTLDIVNIWSPVLERENNVDSVFLVACQLSWIYLLGRSVIIRPRQFDEAFAADPSVSPVTPVEAASQPLRPVLLALGVRMILHDAHGLAHRARGVLWCILYHRAGVFLLMTATYLIAVTPLPPARQSFWRWLSDLSRARDTRDTATM
jgi:hypothetical protein